MPGPHAAHGTGDERAAKLEAILNTAVAAIITIDGSGIIDSVNPATTAMFGYAADELIGRNVKILMPEPYAGQHDGYLASYLSTGERKIIGIGREVIAQRKDGSTFPMHLAVSEFEANGQRHFAGVITRPQHPPSGTGCAEPQRNALPSRVQFRHCRHGPARPDGQVPAG